MIICSKCGNENPDEDNFCNQCGARLVSTNRFSDASSQFVNNPFEDATRINSNNQITCPRCKGSGHVIIKYQGLFGVNEKTETCRVCQGKGTVDEYKPNTGAIIVLILIPGFIFLFVFLMQLLFRFFIR